MSDSDYGGSFPEPADSLADELTVRNGYSNGHGSGSASAPVAVTPHRRVEPGDANFLNELGEKIFLDRYALKDMAKRDLAVGETVVVCVNTTTGQREIGTVAEIGADEVAVTLGDGEIVRRALEHVDRPLELHPDEMQARVARGIAALERPEQRAAWEENFKWLLARWKFVPGGRILTAAGTDQDLTYYNCYVVPSPHDSREGIIHTLSNMTEIMSRGGGVGINLSTLRPRYGYVRGVNGRSSGSVSWGSLYSFVTGLIEQGGSRRGALMLILNVWHPDVSEFITAKRTAGRITNANISVGITDDFMAAAEADADWDLVFPDTSHPAYDTEWDGDLAAWRKLAYPVVTHKTVRARELWNTITESAWASAEPGLWFVERSNHYSNSWYYAPLVSTNPCVTGDTLVYTADGLRRAADLYRDGRPVGAVVNEHGAPAAASPVFRTGRKPVFRLLTTEGYGLRATADHRIKTPRGWVPLGELRVGEPINLLRHKGGFGNTGTLALGRSLGWLVGGGTLGADQAVLSFVGREEKALAPLFARHVNEVVAADNAGTARRQIGVIDVAGRDEARVQSARLRQIAAEHGLDGDVLDVPAAVLTGSEDMQRGFLQALFSAEGGCQELDRTGGRIRLSSPVPALLGGVQMLLLNFGIASRQTRRHELVIGRGNLSTFARELGFLDEARQAKLIDYTARGRRAPYREPFTATVAEIVADGEEDVFDLTEPLTHSFIANGIEVHNCGEQPLPGWSVCNLGAINLSLFAKDGSVDWADLGRTVRYAVRFLDNVIDATPYFFAENEAQQKAERRVGLGTMGLAELMIRCGVRYGSPEGNVFLDQLYRFIAEEAYLASADNAGEKGSFSKFDATKYLESGFMRGMPERVRQAIATKGSRNVTLLTQAPTGTTGTMVATSTGIEPFFSWSYYRKSRLGLHEEKVAVVQEWADAHPGDELPDYFVTAMSLSPEQHVGVQATIQRWVDSAISKTCNVPNSYTVEQTAALYELMFRLGCKGGTVYRDGSRDEQVLMLKEDLPATTEAAPAPEALAVRARPRQMVGTTYRIQTPLGKAYITVNRNSDGEPFEVFVNLGKAGSDLAADAEAIGRLISLSLRMPSPLAPEERLAKIIEELSGIGGSRTVGYGTARVRSLPDGIANALQQDLAELSDEDDADQPSLLFPGADLCPVCGHASFVRVEGCQKCYSCGHSEC
jgi:ribonucleoside-diphosphate reductase alpha chain